eukprot:2031184-Alexandrium_andersonii.AAC.1
MATPPARSDGRGSRRRPGAPVPAGAPPPQAQGCTSASAMYILIATAMCLPSASDLNTRHGAV